MPILLAKNRASEPFFIEKLNIRIYSAEELCYVIYNYPLIAVDGLLSAELISWIEDSLKDSLTAARVRESRLHKDTEDITLAVILQNCDYYTQVEINGFRQKMREYRRLDREELEHGIGSAYFRAERYTAAYEKYSDAVRILDEHLRRTDNPAEKSRLQKRISDWYCDMAVVKLRMFEDDKAKELLTAASLSGKNIRAEQLKALAGFESRLSEQELDNVRSMADNAEKSAAESTAVKKIDSISGKDRVRFRREAAAVLKEWKNRFRANA